MDLRTPVQRFTVFDDDFQRIAVGAELPSGLMIVEWIRESFPEEERTDGPVHSQYHSKEDAEEATGGTVIYEDPT